MKPFIIALGISVAYAQNLPCVVSDGTCVASHSQPVANPQPFEPIQHYTLTATAVITSSCTECGKVPQ